MNQNGAEKNAEVLNGSEILVRALAEEGVKHVFGYPGGSVLNVFDAIFKQDKYDCFNKFFLIADTSFPFSI